MNRIDILPIEEHAKTVEGVTRSLTCFHCTALGLTKLEGNTLDEWRAATCQPNNMGVGRPTDNRPPPRRAENSRCNAYYPLMSADEAINAPRRNAEQAAFLNILRTADVLESEVAALLKPMGLSAVQYNVLRILRAAGKEGMPSGQIAARMLTHDPDVTRLLDRLESRGLIARRRGWSDRRVVAAAITPDGQKLLEKLDRPILQLHRNQLGQLGRQKLRELGELLRLARERTG